MFSFLDPNRKVLVTGSIPTENLPIRRHEVQSKQEHHILVRADVGEPITSSPEPQTLESSIMQLENRYIL